MILNQSLSGEIRFDDGGLRFGPHHVEPVEAKLTVSETRPVPTPPRTNSPKSNNRQCCGDVLRRNRVLLIEHRTLRRSCSCSCGMSCRSNNLHYVHTSTPTYADAQTHTDTHTHTQTREGDISWISFNCSRVRWRTRQSSCEFVNKTRRRFSLVFFFQSSLDWIEPETVPWLMQMKRAKARVLRRI